MISSISKANKLLAQELRDFNTKLHRAPGSFPLHLSSRTFWLHSFCPKGVMATLPVNTVRGSSTEEEVLPNWLGEVKAVPKRNVHIKRSFSCYFFHGHIIIQALGVFLNLHLGLMQIILEEIEKFYWINIQETFVWYKFFYGNKPLLVCQRCHHKVL